MPLYLYSKTVPCIYFAVPSKTDFQNTILVSSSTSVYSRTQSETKFNTKGTYIQNTQKKIKSSEVYIVIQEKIKIGI